MSAIKYMSWLTACSVFAALFSILFHAFSSFKQFEKLTIVLAGLLALEGHSRESIPVRPRIAVGYGSCSDLFVSATRFLNFTDAAHNIEPDFSVDDVTNEEEFLRSFAFYFKNGAAAERFTPDKYMFGNLISYAKTKFKNEIRWEIGGNAPIMGIRFQKEGAEVLLGSRMSHKYARLKRLLPENLRFAGDLVEDDDIHLILEYKSGEKWGPYTAPRANRYILHNDQNNPQISSLEMFGSVLEEFDPRLLVVSGIQMMDSFKFAPGVREGRLEKVENQLAAQTNSTLIHFEMASYVEIELLQLLIKHIIPYSDSIGMNEQELDNLAQVLEHGRVSFATDSNPRVAATLDRMRKVFTRINTNYFQNQHSDKQTRMLTRLHVHTLAYQAILIVKDSQWKNTKNAAAKAALTAFRHVCGTEFINPHAANLILDDSFATSANGYTGDTKIPERIKVERRDPVPCWSEILTVDNKAIEYEICVAPVLVCQVAKQTAGAGDNISASGLILQI